MALVEEPHLRLLDGCQFDLRAGKLPRSTGNVKLSDLARERATGEVLEYDPIYRGQSDWRILPAIDHPAEPARCLVSGTGLTHLGSARNRQSMHAASEADLTDSMKMFRWGIEGGSPAPGLDRNRSRVVLQRHGHNSARTRRGARRAAVCRRWWRGGGTCGHLHRSLPTASRVASGWRVATNFQITYSRRRTI